jgi:heme/copper-type cytochrome/quinol oxidase subunit 2
VADLMLNLRAMLLVLCLLMFGAVFAIMLVSLWRHHRGQSEAEANFHGSVAVEICWALAPCVIVLLMVWPTVRAVFRF